MATIPNRSIRRRNLSRKGRRPHFTRPVAAGHGRESFDGDFTRLLDEAHERLSDQRCGRRVLKETMDRFINALRACKLSCDEHQWREFIEAGRRHRVKDLLHEDPFTFHAFRRPRDYPGDADLLDLIYGCEEQWPAPEASPLGRRLFDYTISAPAPEGVRARRGFVADLLDRLAADVPMPHVLSIAAGHLREASLSAALKRRKIGRFVALDSDPISLDEVQRCYACFGVETVPVGIRRLLTNQADLGSFDLVYSTGLFDYLGQPTGRRLVWGMFQMLRPGGCLMVANFVPGVRDVGYMEIFMDWHLIYRTRQEMIEMTMEIPQEEIDKITLFAEETQNVLFLQVTKK